MKAKPGNGNHAIRPFLKDAFIVSTFYDTVCKQFIILTGVF